MARLWLRYALSAPVESTMWGWILRDQGNSWHLPFVVIVTQVSSTRECIKHQPWVGRLLNTAIGILLVILMIVTVPYRSTQYSSFPQMSWCLDWLMCHINKSLSWLSKILFRYSNIFIHSWLSIFKASVLFLLSVLYISYVMKEIVRCKKGMPNSK